MLSTPPAIYETRLCPLQQPVPPRSHACKPDPHSRLTRSRGTVHRQIGRKQRGHARDVAIRPRQPGRAGGITLLTSAGSILVCSSKAVHRVRQTVPGRLRGQLPRHSCPLVSERQPVNRPPASLAFITRSSSLLPRVGTMLPDFGPDLERDTPHPRMPGALHSSPAWPRSSRCSSSASSTFPINRFSSTTPLSAACPA